MFSLQDKSLAKHIVTKLKPLGLHLQFMHVCGTHQDTLVKHGLDVLLQESGIRIGQGPGCPVCVTTPREIEEILTLAQSGKTITSFGDMIQVPGQTKSLQTMKTEGYDIQTVYGIEDAVVFAKNHPEKELQSYSFMVEVNGKRLIYSGDIDHITELTPFMEDANVLMVEVAHYDPEGIKEFIDSYTLEQVILYHIHPGLETHIAQLAQKWNDPRISIAVDGASYNI